MILRGCARGCAAGIHWSLNHPRPALSVNCFEESDIKGTECLFFLKKTGQEEIGLNSSNILRLDIKKSNFIWRAAWTIKAILDQSFL